MKKKVLKTIKDILESVGLISSSLKSINKTLALHNEMIMFNRKEVKRFGNSLGYLIKVVEALDEMVEQLEDKIESKSRKSPAKKRANKAKDI